MRFVAFQHEILATEVKQVLDGRIEPHAWQGARRPGELQPGLLQMIAVKVRIAKRVDELAGRKPADLRGHQG